MRDKSTLLILATILAVQPEPARPFVLESVGPAGGRVDGWAQSAAAPDRMYLLPYRHGVMRSDDRGASWDALSPGLPRNLVYEAVAASSTDPTLVLVAPQIGEDLQRSTDAGDTWSPVHLVTGLGTVEDISFDPFDGSRVLASVQGGGAGLYVSTDAGLTWAPSGAGLTGDIGHVAWHPGQPGTVLIATSTDVFRSTDGGMTWTGAGLAGGTRGSVSYCRDAPQNVWASASTGALRSTDGGTTFVATSTPSEDASYYFVAPHPSQPDHVVLGYIPYSFQAWTSRAIRSTNGGQTWGPYWSPNAGANQVPTSLFGDIEDPAVFYFAVGRTASAIDHPLGPRLGAGRSTDGGATWAPWMLGANGLELLCLAHDGAGTLWTCGPGSRGLWSSPDAGVTWAELSVRRSAFLYPTVLHPVRGNPDWILQAGYTFSSDTKDPRYHRSTDRGQTWSEGVVQSSSFFSEPHTIATDQSGRWVYLWSDTSDEPTLSRSQTIGGDMVLWQVNSGFLAADAFVEAGDSTAVWLVSENEPYGVWHSTDGGLLWMNRSLGLPQDVGVALLPGSAESGPTTEMVAVFRTAGAYRTTDAGASWTAVVQFPDSEGRPLIAADRDLVQNRLFLATTDAVWVGGHGWVEADPAFPLRDMVFEPVSGDLFVATFGNSVQRLSIEETVGAPVVSSTPGNLSILAAPNPSRGEVVLQWVLPASGQVRLEVMDVAGRRVATLLDAEVTAGRHELAWSGQSAAGRPVSSGVYFARLVAGGTARTARVTIVTE